MSGVRKTYPLIKKSRRQCIFKNTDGSRCKENALGHFFCQKHLLYVSKVESCSLSSSDFAVVG